MLPLLNKLNKFQKLKATFIGKALEFFLNLNFTKCLISFIFLIISVIASNYYPGNKIYLVFFDGLSLLILLNAMRKKAYFFDIFIAFYLTVGFFLKFNLNTYLGGLYFRDIALFASIADVDKSLEVSSIAFTGILFARVIAHYFLPKRSLKILLPISHIHKVYKRNRLAIILFFILVMLIVNITNIYYEIYTKGGISSANPIIFNFYKYFISFGFTFFLLYLLQIELYMKDKFPIIFGGLIFFENMCSSASQFSRVMILNSSAILIGIVAHCRAYLINLNIRAIASLFILIFGLFLISFEISEINREKYFMSANLKHDTKEFNSSTILINENEKKDNLEPIFIESFIAKYPHLATLISLITKRIVGIEGVIAVTSCNQLNWNFFISSVKEKDVRGLSFYDKYIYNSPYSETDFSKKQFVTLPGFIAYFFYAGSFLFLFLSTTVLGLIGYIFEWFARYISSENYMVTSFVSQLYVYRLVNFGYIPLNTIQYFLVIFFTLILYFTFFKFLNYKYGKLLPLAK